jgi:molybdopterin converting factor small subunit
MTADWDTVREATQRRVDEEHAKATAADVRDLREKYEAMREEWSKAVDERDAAIGWAADYKDRWETLGRVAKKQLDRATARTDELEAEVKQLRALLAEVNRQDRVQLRRALDADVRANIDRLRQELRRAEEKN